MAPPAFQAIGTGHETSVPWPTHSTGHFGLLLIEVATELVAYPAGWTFVGTSQRSDTRLYAFYKFATSGAESNVTIPGVSVNHAWGVIVTYTGVDTTRPVSLTAASSSAANTSMSAPLFRTLTNDNMLVCAMGWAVDSQAAGLSSSEANSTLTSVTNRYDNGTDTGNGGGIAITDGTLATAGDAGVFTATLVSTAHSVLVIALQPPQPATPVDPPTPIYGTYPAIDTDLNTIVSFGTTWSYGIFCDETSGDLEESYGSGEAFEDIGGNTATYDVDGFLAGSDRGVEFAHGSSTDGFTWSGSYTNMVPDATEDLLVAMFVKFREGDTTVKNVLCAGAEGDAGWRLTFDGDDLVWTVEDGTDSVSATLPIGSTPDLINRWICVIACLQRSTNTAAIGIAYDTGSGLSSDIDGSAGNAASIGSLDGGSVDIELGVSVNDDSAGMVVAAFFTSRGVGAAGTVAANIDDAAENLYDGVLASAGGGSGTLTALEARHVK